MEQMERIEEFEIGGKNFMYIDLTMLKNTDELREVAGVVKAAVAKYPEASLHMITNLGDFWLDSESMSMFEQCIALNVNYTKACAITGMDGIKKLMVKAAAKKAGKSGIVFSFTKERAIELLLAQT